MSANICDILGVGKTEIELGTYGPGLIKISILKWIVELLGIAVAYLVDGEESNISAEVIRWHCSYRGIQNEELRKVAME